MKEESYEFNGDCSILYTVLVLHVAELVVAQRILQEQYKEKTDKSKDFAYTLSYLDR